MERTAFQNSKLKTALSFTARVHILYARHQSACPAAEAAIAPLYV